MKKRINGSIRPRPNAEDVQYYDITLELGTDPATGKRKRMYFKVNTTDREEAENELMIKKAEYLQEKLLEPSKETVTEFMERFWKIREEILVRLRQEITDKRLRDT